MTHTGQCLNISAGLLAALKSLSGTAGANVEGAAEAAPDFSAGAALGVHYGLSFATSDYRNLLSLSLSIVRRVEARVR